MDQDRKTSPQKFLDPVAKQISQNFNSEEPQWAKIREEAQKCAAHYRQVISNIRTSGRTVLRFAAYVANDAMYGIDKVFRMMMAEPERFSPKVVVIPDVCRGMDHQEPLYQKTREHFIKKYGPEYVLDGWDQSTDTYFDHTDSFDIIYFADPYDAMAHPYHTIRYASGREVLPFYVNYGYDVAFVPCYSRLKSAELNLVWKCFTETRYSYEDYRKYQIIQGENVVLTGYSKLDAFADYPRVRHKRKKILIASHHSVSLDIMHFSNFLSCYDLISELPVLFPEADFVFRPHPLLFISLIRHNLWTREEIDDYLKVLKSRGVEYSDGGDYLSIFAECDAIVHDCGSFTVEWLFTGKPGCFVYSDKQDESDMTALMKKALEGYTIARSRDDIVDFIRKVVNGEFSAEEKMEDWVREYIAVNYPHASEKMLEELDILSGSADQVI